MIAAHLTASTFFGGPERQMLGLARHMLPATRSVFLSFAEGGRCRAFLDAAVEQRFPARALKQDTPWLRAASRELARVLAEVKADVLCCHGYKADLLGRLAARRRGIPAVAVSRGWTGESFKVRMYEALDRLNLRWMDRVVCVSEGQAAKVRRAGADPARVCVIRNAIDPGRFADPDLRCLRWLHEQYQSPRRLIVASAGRLSPEKGFEVLVEAAAQVVARDAGIGFIHFGDGPGRAGIARTIAKKGLQEHFMLAGLRHDLDRFYPFFDLLVLPSYTEGLPNVVLEAFAARVPVVATAVGGTPEIVEDGISGFLVAPGNPDALAQGIHHVLASDERRIAMGERGYRRVCEDFTFAAQARAYERLFAELLPHQGTRPASASCTAGKESLVR
jgi:glycosyltransferase involved in cell wall biosynthesis